MSITRPLLAAKRDKSQTEEDFLDSLPYPLSCTRKLDGIRCLKVNQQIVSRSFKPIPNDHVRGVLSRLLPDGIDGELMVRGNADFNEVQSQIMTIKGAPQFEYWAFDYVKDSLEKPYLERMQDLQDWFENVYPTKRILPLDIFHEVKIVLPITINDTKELLEFEHKVVVDEGFEGVMVRTPDSIYKCGRATLREGILTKVVRVFRDEAVVVGFEEKMKNDNEQELDEFGLAKRSSKKEGKSGASTLGRLTVEMPSGIQFGIGTGFNDAQRKEIWDNQDKYLGKTVTYEYRHLSRDSVPRFPAWVGVRHRDDQ
jgi:DNA ligase-1